MHMNELYFIDTTFRDGPHSLWAQNITTGMLLPVASEMDQIGFRAMELMGSGHFKKCIRELNEDPWEKMRVISKKITKTPLAFMMLPSVTTFDLTPLSVLKLYIERLSANGIKRLQLMEASNDMNFRVPEMLRFAKDVGLQVVIGLVYSVSPRHTVEHYAKKTLDAAKLQPDGIYLKDSAGLLTPETTRAIIPLMLQNAQDIPLEIHSHCTTGLAPLCYLEAIKLGIRIVHTACPPLANGSSQPSVINVARNAHLLGYTPTIDEESIKPITNHFTYIAKREGLPMGAPLEYDLRQYTHQVPGGVISHLKHQLSQLGKEDRLEEVLKEISQVRKDLGYPIMVTPFSQFIGTQAAINVILGERYKEAPDEVIQYVLGFWGEEAASFIDPNVKDKILSFPRAKEFSNWKPPEPSIKEVRQKLGGPDLPDDELILRYIVPKQEIEAMRAVKGPVREYTSVRTPIVTLIQELTKYKDLNYIHIQKRSFSLTLSNK